MIKFKIHGNLRFLSHAEMMTVFERAISRSQINIKYSQGFNPHPKLSLPFPRPVGAESEDDLLCIKIQASLSDFDSKDFKNRLLAQLPQGFDILDVAASKTKKSPQPLTTDYVFAIKPEFSDEKLKNRVEQVKNSPILNVKRDYGDDFRAKILNVRDFLKSIDFDGKIVTAQCAITSVGSIRIGEVLQLLDLDEEKLASPIIRKNVQWQMN